MRRAAARSRDGARSALSRHRRGGRCCWPRRARADEFFRVRDENPLIRGFYLPLPSDGRLSDGADLSATLSISNTLNVENRGQREPLVDGESDVLRLSYEDALYPAWRFRLTVPLIHDSGGFLDSTIDHWHHWFGFNPGNRPFYPQNQLVYSYSGRGSVDLTRAQTSLGDISAELGWFPIDDAHRTLSLWGGVEAPTGSVVETHRRRRLGWRRVGAWRLALAAVAVGRGTWAGTAFRR